jgi:ABC-type metal ion transport system substrate-binding protein
LTYTIYDLDFAVLHANFKIGEGIDLSEPIEAQRRKKTNEQTINIEAVKTEVRTRTESQREIETTRPIENTRPAERGLSR